ncbi:hypothetical protein [Methanocaldococcus fervens]|uniref:Uncharacterized protein n=1 Tax=Methanocaldococcus fervens (strain DSM 4213 / JCM 15782 / AG86) TaxID=573064 RepID=C7P8S4_METFA|nr:hypothetical protein [Methanocaldococcus fervens]ACV24956.1 hypothetical protein Mefer_1146 [Methanocaldococcus fervens AG86]
MTLLLLLILVFGLVGFGLLLGYLLFGRRREVVYTTGEANRMVVVDRRDNLLGTAAAVAGGVVAGELIADAMEDLMDRDVEEEIINGVDDVGETISDAVDDFGDIDF